MGELNFCSISFCSEITTEFKITIIECGKKPQVSMDIKRPQMFQRILFKKNNRESNVLGERKTVLVSTMNSRTQKKCRALDI